MITNRGSHVLGAVFGSALVLALAPNAMAGEDIYGGGLKGGYEVPPPPPTNRGIYVRGFIGQANPHVGSIWVPGFATTTVAVFHNDIKSTPFYGLGVGYKHSHWLRFDLTGEYRGDALFLAQDRAPNAGQPNGLQTNEYTADVSSWLGLVNAYWDIGTWCGFTPYLGAGIGFSTLTVEGFKDVNVPTQGVAFGAANTRTNFAWAVHAGVSYDVSPQFAVDLAYRYADLGDASTGVVTAYDNTSSYANFTIRDITSNDVMLGFRYKLHREQPAYVMK